jgi:hypothetical protein
MLRQGWRLSFFSYVYLQLHVSVEGQERCAPCRAASGVYPVLDQDRGGMGEDRLRHQWAVRVVDPVPAHWGAGAGGSAPGWIGGIGARTAPLGI